jgi:chemotaxis protein MotB
MRGINLPLHEKGLSTMRHARMTGWTSCALALIASGLVGCDSAKQQNDTLLKENEALKAQLDDRNAALERADQERQDAIARAADAESKLQSAQAAGAEPSASTAPDTSAFAGIEGVTATAKGKDVHVSIEGDVLFDSGRDELKAAAKRSLDKIAAIIKQQHPNAEIRVAGFTDTDPIKFSKFKSNYLGFDRAFSVREYLVSKGLESKRVSLSSYGPDVPLATKAKSRRVEVIVVGG